MSDAVTIDLEDLDARKGWILVIRIDCEGGAEVSPLPVKLLLAIILCSYRLHRFLGSADITQERRSGGRREIFHKLCGCG